LLNLRIGEEFGDSLVKSTTLLGVTLELLFRDEKLYMSLDEGHPGGVTIGAPSVALLRLLVGDSMPEDMLGFC
jgi:hypothetical protein